MIKIIVIRELTDADMYKTTLTNKGDLRISQNLWYNRQETLFGVPYSVLDRYSVEGMLIPSYRDIIRTIYNYKLHK